MSVLSVQTKKISELQATTGLVGSDMIIVELAGGGTRKMTYATLLQILTDAIVGGGSQVLSPLIREQNCINNGASGIKWDLDKLMALVQAGKMDEFAIGDYFIDGGVTWRIFAKNHYPRWAFDDSTAGDNVPPNHIVCLPDTSLGSYQFNTTNTNSGGYAGSLMPGNMVTEYNKLSTELKGYVKETQIYENNKSAWAAAKRYMRLPTVVEMTGNQSWADQYSGGVCSQFPLAQATKHRIKDYWYWLLDPVAFNVASFCGVGGTGGSYDGSASSSSAVRPEIVLA